MPGSHSRLPRVVFVGIIVALAVVALIAKVSLINRDSANQITACEHEYTTVQGGLYVYIAMNNLSSVPASDGTSDMATPVPLYKRTATATNPSYVPNSQTTWLYAWTSDGRITSIIARPDGPSIPVGCVVYGD